MTANHLIAAGVRSARKLGYTPDWLRHRAAVYRHNALAYTGEEARERALGLAYHYEQVADALEAKLTRERDEARAERDAMANVPPGHYYMDPPDGGDVPVLEQLRRMAKDAERYRFLSCKGVPPYFHRCSRWRLEYWNGEWWDPLMKEELDAAIDAQIEKEKANGSR